MNKEDRKVLRPANLYTTAVEIIAELYCLIEKDELRLLNVFRSVSANEKQINKYLAQYDAQDVLVEKISRKLRRAVDRVETTGRKRFKWSDTTVNWIKEMEG